MGNELACCNSKLNEKSNEATDLIDYSNVKDDEDVN
jgi:hypothetical protein